MSKKEVDIDSLERTASASLKIEEIKKAYNILNIEKIPHQITYAFEEKVLYIEILYFMDTKYHFNYYKEDDDGAVMRSLAFDTIKGFRDFLRAYSMQNKRFRMLLRSEFIKQQIIFNSK